MQMPKSSSVMASNAQLENEGKLTLTLFKLFQTLSAFPRTAWEREKTLNNHVIPAKAGIHFLSFPHFTSECISPEKQKNISLHTNKKLKRQPLISTLSGNRFPVIHSNAQRGNKGKVCRKVERIHQYRHSCEGRNPLKFSWLWIPAFAGMTKGFFPVTWQKPEKNITTYTVLGFASSAPTYEQFCTALLPCRVSNPRGIN